MRRSLGSVMTSLMEHSDEKGHGALRLLWSWSIVMTRAWSIFMRRSWNILMTCVMKLCDDKGMEHCDYRGLGAL